jgi:DNA topoisomerase-1
VRDPDDLARIRRLAIPPAWKDVWICPEPRGHMQATARDARGRKQYRYHPRWREMRDAHKFDRMIEFARVLPAVRRRAAEDLKRPGLPREKVLATLVRLLETTCLRIGNERYAEENDSFGLTTLRNRHVKVAGTRVEFQFRGKSGKFHQAQVDDPHLARIIRRCRELPGQTLFEYLDGEGKAQSIGSADVNDYLKEISGAEITAKDFRTWAGTMFVANALARREGPVGPSHMVAAVREASKRLGNTPAICRKSYVHPRVLDPQTWRARATRRSARRFAGSSSVLPPVRCRRMRRPRSRSASSRAV